MGVFPGEVISDPFYSIYTIHHGFILIFQKLISVGSPGSTFGQLLPGIGMEAKTVFYGIQQVRCHDLRFIRGFSYFKTALA
jgi:hypothetical protein